MGRKAFKAAVENAKRKADRVRAISLEYAFRPALPKPQVVKPKKINLPPIQGNQLLFLIDKFWREIVLNKGQELEILKRYADIELCNRKLKKIKKMRAGLGNSFCHELRSKPCLGCGGRSELRHHIITLRHGGSNSIRNLAPLCNVCHAEIHPWLKQPA